MIFDVKMDDFCCKARFVIGDHTIDKSYAMTCASVVSRKLVIIIVTLAALNDLDVKMADI
jgi:hypothetical protein